LGYGFFSDVVRTSAPLRARKQALQGLGSVGYAADAETSARAIPKIIPQLKINPYGTESASLLQMSRCHNM
jgi:hypothetical protein